MSTTPAVRSAVRAAVRFARTATLDPATSAFAALSGATDLAKVDAVVRYLKEQDLWADAWFVPLKSTQNAGSGATAYALGGAGGGDLTLHNSPTWGTDGITLNGTNQYLSAPDFLGSETITAFNRFEITGSLLAYHSIIGQDNNPNARSWRALWNWPGSRLRLVRSVDGSLSGQELYDGTDVDLVGEVSICSQWIDGGGRNLWIEKTAQALTLSGGESRTSRADSALPIVLGASYKTGVLDDYFAGRMTAALILRNTAPTTAQRERLTDLINAL
jgi:hypothetical protein